MYKRNIIRNFVSQYTTSYDYACKKIRGESVCDRAQDTHQDGKFRKNAG